MNKRRMKITIDFDSSWQNGFINGEDGLNEKGRSNIRPFFATSKSKQITDKPLTKNTILGVLGRLLGDQRKLYDARKQNDYYFKDCEDSITYKVDSIIEYDETAIVINKNGSRCAPTTYLGVLPNDTELFYSNFSKNLWSVLDLSIEGVCDYILSESITKQPQGAGSVNRILNRIADLSNKEMYPQFETVKRITENYNRKISQQKERLALLGENDKKSEKIIQKIELLSSEMKDAIICNTLLDSKIVKVAEKIEHFFGDTKLIENDAVYVIKLYGAALYLTATILQRDGLANFLSDKNKLTGFAEGSFSFNGIRDFLNTLAGVKKKTIRTPANIRKQTGQLIIEVDEPIDTQDLYQKIENAGVSSFYLGKKGLAYVSDIRV